MKDDDRGSVATVCSSSLWNVFASFIVLALMVPFLFGVPKRVPGVYGSGWSGQGMVASWFIQQTNKGWFMHIWSDPKRTGVPVDAATTLKTY